MDTKISGIEPVKGVNKTHKLVGLEKLRREAGLSQSGLAERIGLSQQAISDYETGNRTPSLMAADKLASGLEVDVGKIVEAVKEQKVMETTS